MDESLFDFEKFVQNSRLTEVRSGKTEGTSVNTGLPSGKNGQFMHFTTRDGLRGTNKQGRSRRWSLMCRGREEV